MVLHSQRQPLRATELPTPKPGSGEVLLRVCACAVCRTDLHVVDGELPHPRAAAACPDTKSLCRRRNGRAWSHSRPSDRVGVRVAGVDVAPVCEYCRSRPAGSVRPGARFTGYTRDGGYADYTVADQRYCIPIPAFYPDAEAAPLLCAGLIGYRSLARPATPGEIGIYGFGAAAHIITQVARFQGREVYAFTSEATGKGRGLPGRSGPCGPGIRTLGHPRNSMRQSYSRPLVSLCRRHSKRSQRAAWWSAAAFT